MAERERVPGEDDHYRSLYPPSEYVAADEFPLGRDVVVTIEAVTVRSMPVEGSSKKEDKPVLKFEGRKKRWPLPKTVAKQIAKLHGEAPRGWVGKSVTLYRTTCKGKGGDAVACVRARPIAPSASTPRDVEPEHDGSTGDGPPPAGVAP